jgi:hypothetical protein
MMKDSVTHSHVYNNGKKDAHPDRNVVRIELEKTPVCTYPAPQLKKISCYIVTAISPGEDTYRSITVDQSTRPVMNGDQDDGWDCWATKANQAVDPSISSESCRVCVVKEDKIDID